MKLSKIAPAFWIANVVLLAGGLALAWGTMQDSKQERAEILGRVGSVSSDEAAIHWQDKRKDDRPVDARHFLLSPKARPVEKAPVVGTDEPPPPRPKTDEQLRRELEAELRRRFTVVRLVLCNSEQYTDSAMLVSGGAKLHWFEGINLRQRYQGAQSVELHEFALDINVIEVDREGVLLDAPSFEKPEKRFEIRLPLGEKDPGHASFYSSGRALRFDEELNPKDEGNRNKPDGSTPPADPDPTRKLDDDTVDPDDFSDADIDELMKYARSTEHGVEILPDLPQDNALRNYGARGGEIIKSINGAAVKSGADIRKTVRQQYDNGTREFEVIYERDGVPGSRTIKAPRD